MYDLEWPLTKIHFFVAKLHEIHLVIYCMLSLMLSLWPFQLLLKVLNETNSCLHTLYRAKVIAPMRHRTVSLQQDGFLVIIVLIGYCCRLREQRERSEQRHQDEIELLTKKSAEHKTRSEALQTDVNNRQVISRSAEYHCMIWHYLQQGCPTFLTGGPSVQISN